MGEKPGATKKLANSPVQTAGYDSQSDVGTRIKTSTISLPPSMAQRIAASRNAEKNGVKTTLKKSALNDEVIHRASRADNVANTSAVEGIRIPSEFPSEQPESSASSPVSSPRKVFGAPGTFN
jgi:hypothetical protein